METNDPFGAALAGAQFGNTDSVSWLWRRHQPVLIAWLSSFDRTLAHDVASDVWIEAIRAIGGFSGDERAFRSWLFTIARRRLIDVQRRDQRRHSLTEAGRSQDSTEDTSTEEKVIAGLASQEAIDRIRANLTPEQAEIVLLRVIAGLDIDQVSAAIGKKPGAIRVMQHRALRKLALALQPEAVMNEPFFAKEV